MFINGGSGWENNKHSGCEETLLRPANCLSSMLVCLLLSQVGWISVWVGFPLELPWFRYKLSLQIFYARFYHHFTFTNRAISSYFFNHLVFSAHNYPKRWHFNQLLVFEACDFLYSCEFLLSLLSISVWFCVYRFACQKKYVLTMLLVIMRFFRSNSLFRVWWWLCGI